ncbi:MAG: hypothetical protein GX811_01815 [Lentisphaerae bacterium]|nr:hypothetical protein [Lentisphaerota bacterium]
MALFGSTVNGADKISIRETTEDGEKLVHMENNFYEAIFVPEKAIFPLTYKFKASDKDMLVRLPTIAEGIARGDGIQLCMPWVGDSKRRVQSNGLLRSADWTIATSSDDNTATLTAKTSITYNDPVSSNPATLNFSILIKGTAKDSGVVMEYNIVNSGESAANLMFVAHSRPAPESEYKDGDYLATNGDKCWVGDYKWESLTAAEVKPHSCTKWPIKGADEFFHVKQEDKKGEYVYAFIPADWMIVGNGTTRNFLLYHASPFKISNKEETAKQFFCILKREHDYLVEVGLSQELDAAYWEEPGAVVKLHPAASLDFSLTIAGGNGLNKADASAITSIKDGKINFKDAEGKEKCISLGANK